MKELSFSEVLNKISKGNLLPQQFYNVDLDYTQHFATSHFLKNKEDNIDKNQKLNKFFTDIEVYTKHSGEFPEVKHAKFPINAISTYSSIDDTCHCFFMFYDKSQVKPEKEIEDYLFNESLKDGYISKNQKIKVYLFDNSKDLVIAFWNLVKTQDPSVLSGFFSDSFDYPYMYYFLLNQFNGDHQAVANIISKFGVVDLDNGRDRAGKDIAWIRPAEYVICDLLYFYKPRDDGGLSLGKKLPAYNLAFVSEYELGISKLEYKQKGLTLDRFWEKDPLNFLLYNVWDCLLCYKLDEKLGMIDQYNIQRRAMKTPMGTAIRGSSPLFDTFVCYSLTDTNQYIRFGIVDEPSISIPQSFIETVQKPKEKITWNIESIDKREYRKIISHYAGAIVKEPTPGIITDGIISDLDASLPPDEKILIRRFNEIIWIEIGEYNFIPGDETLTWDKNNNTCWKLVKGKIEHNWNNKLIKIKTETGKTVTVTSNHSIFGLKKKNRSFNYSLISAGNLEVGDYVVVSKQYDSISNSFSETIGLEKIKSIEVIDYCGKVYDISVDETERFFAGTGIGVHNTSLYPSCIRQYNIGFDTFVGRVLSPVTNKTIEFLRKFLGKGIQIPNPVYPDFLKLAIGYMEKLKPQNKNNEIQRVYFVLCYLLDCLNKTNKTFDDLIVPKNINDYMILRSYLLPFLDLIEEVHPTSREYHPLCYDWIINNKNINDCVWVVDNMSDPNISLINISWPEFISDLKNKQNGITLTGCIFKNHENQVGFFNDFLKNMYSLRKQYKKQRDEFDKLSDDYKIYDRRQFTMKVLMNSTYGLFGMSSYRYSNKWLAKSITTQGRLALKTAQFFADLYLKNKYGTDKQQN